jgi:hypothetical protein
VLPQTAVFGPARLCLLQGLDPMQLNEQWFLGLEAEAAGFFNCLAGIYRVELDKATPGISEETFT